MTNDLKRKRFGRLCRLAITLAFFALAILLPVSKVGAQEVSSESSPPPVTVPAQPTGLQVDTDTGSLSVAVDWDDVSGASQYLVRWRVAGPGNTLNTGVEAQTSNASITVTDFGEWVVRVEACNSAGCGSHRSVRFSVDPAAAPTPTPETTTETDLAPTFSLAITGLSFQENEEITETTLPEAEGGDGTLTYSVTPSLPGGLSFAAATRTISGTPSESGEFSMTYTATDEDGDAASFNFKITVQSAPQTGKAKTGPDAPGSLKAVRVPSATQMKPALDVTWTTPADNGFTITKYNVYYGTDKDNMTKVSPDPVAGTTSLRLTDLSPGATYFVRILAFAGNHGQDGTAGDRADTSAKTNSPPTTTTTYIAVQDIEWLDSIVDPNPMSDFFNDADSDTLTYSISSQYPGIVNAWLDVDPGLYFAVRADNPASSSITYGASDGYGGYASRTVKLTGVANPTLSVMENSPAGTLVGDPVAGTPYDDGDDATDDALTHTLTGEAATYFDINAATGQISVKQGTSLDYETKNSYTGKVKWTVQDQQAVANLTINVGDIAPDKPAAPTVARTEFSEPSAPALDVTWTAPNANGTTISGYGAQYRVKVAEGETENAWTAYSGTLSATATTLNLAGLTAGATYEVQVRAHSNEGSGPWSDAGEGRANRAPTTAVLLSDSTIPWLESRDYDLADSGGAYFQDADGDTLTYSASSTYDCIIGVSVEGSVLTITALNPDSSSVQYFAVDPYGGRASRTVTITGSGNVTREVPEQAAAGTNVGAPITASPCAEEHISYGFDGEASSSGAFVIDHETGQISVAEGATLDYETKSSYTGRVHWVVHSDQHPAVDVTINVTDVGAAKPSTPTVTRTTFTEPTNPALDVTWTAAASLGGATITGHKVQYRKKVADGETANAWTLYEYEDPDNAGSQISLLPATTTSINLPDLDAGATYEARVQGISSEDGAGPWSDIGSGQANRAPISTGYYISSANLDVYARVFPTRGMPDFFTDPDGDGLQYAVSSNYPGILGVWLEIKDGKEWLIGRYTNPGTAIVTYGAHDGYGGYYFLTAKWAGSLNVERSVLENSPEGTAVGRPVTGTPYEDETRTFTLTGKATDAFVIDSSTGQISVAEGATLDYETEKSYTGKVEYTVQEQEVAIGVTINVTDVEAGKPGTPTLSRTEFTEKTDPALDVEWTAADTNGLTMRDLRTQYRKKVAEGETPAAWIEGTTKATATSLNLSGLEAGATYEFRLRARSIEESGGPWSDIGEGTANTPPTVNGANLADATIALANATDYDISDKFADADGDTLTYAASSAYPGVVTAAVTGNDSDTLTVTAVNPAASTVTYGVSDGYGGHVSRTVTITGQDSVTRSVAEKSVAGTAVGDPVTGTPHGTETLSYTLTGEAATSGDFVIDAATGQISVKTGATLVYETKNSYTGTVTWTVQGQTATASLTINVTEVQATLAAAPTVTRTQFSEPTDPALDVTWKAATANGLTITGYEAQYRKKVADGETANAWTLYQYEDPDNAGSQISLLSATTTSINLPGLDAGATYEAQVRALTSEVGEGPWSDTGEGTANQPPAWNGVFFLDIGTLTWNSIVSIQNSLADHFTDADGDTLTYSASSEYVGIINAWVEGAHPKLRVYNPAASVVTFRASDPYGGVSDTFTHKYVGSANVTRTVRENSPADTMVGDRVQGHPYNGQALTYTLTGDLADSGNFYIKPFGRIRVKSGADLDYETTSTYTGKVEYTIQGQPVAINVTVNVIDVEAVMASAPTLTRTEFSEPTDPALDVTWTAATANGLTITGYEAQYRKKVADGETANAWTLYQYEDPDNAGSQISLLSATTTSINLPGLDAGATYEAQVRAVTSEEGEGPWSDTGEGTANQPPAWNGVFFLDIGTLTWNSIVSIQNSLADHFTDADGDTLTYSASSEYVGIINAWVEGAHPKLRVYNPAASVVTFRASDPYGGVSNTFTHKYVGSANVTRTVRENSPADTMVGDRVQGHPYNGQALTYTLTGELADSGNFYIKPFGRIRVKSGADLDYETTSTYTGKVEYTIQGQPVAINVTVNVIDVEAVMASAPTLKRTEFSEQSDPALDVTWTAAAANGLTITGYEAQYRKKVADGETANAWTLYKYEDPNNAGSQISLLSATTTSINLPGLDAGATYEAQVRAVTSEEGEGPWSDSGEGTANLPPTALGADLADGTVSVGASADSGIGDKFEDADGDTLTFSASSQYPGVLTVAVTGNDSNILTVTAINPASATFTYGASDGYGGYVTRTVTMTGQQGVTRSVAENAAAGAAVGDPVTGTPHGTDTLSYTLTGEAATSGAFVIDSTTGQISVKQGATLDYETKDFYTGSVEYTIQGQAASVGLTINISDVGTGKPDTPTVTRTTFSGPSNPALDVTWQAVVVDGATITGYKAQYRKKVDPGESPAAWTAYTGTLSAATTSLNLSGLDAGAIYEAQVRAVTSEEGEGPWSDIAEGKANKPPTAGTIPDQTGAANSQGSLSADNYFNDPESDSLTYEVSTDQPNLIDVGDGRSDTVAWRYLDTGQSQITVTGHDGYGGSVSKAFAVTATQALVSPPPTPSPPLPPLALPSPDPTSINLSVSPSFLSESDGETEVIVTATYEQSGSLTRPVTVRITLAGTASNPADYTASSVDVVILAGSSSGSVILTLTPVEDDVSEQDETIKVLGTAQGFTVNASTITLSDAGSAPALVSVREPGAPVSEGSTVSLPVSLSAPVGATVTVTWSTGGSEPEPAIGPRGQSQRQPVTPKSQAQGHEHTPSSGTVTFQPGETQSSISIRILDDMEHEDLESFLIVLDEVIVSSAGQARASGQSSSNVSFGDRTALVTIADNDAPPEFGEGGDATRSVAENTPAGTPIGQPITATDADGDTVNYTLSGADAGAFTLDSATGQLMTRLPLDFETKAVYDSLTVTADDGHEHTDTLSLTVSVTDVNEPPPRPDAPSVTRSSTSPSSELSVTWSAPDMTGRSPLTSYDVSYKAAEESVWTRHPHIGLDTITVLTGLQANTTYEVKIRAYNEDGPSPWSSPGKDSTAEQTAPEPVTSTPTPTPTPVAPTPTPVTPTPTPTPTPVTPTATPTPTPVTPTGTATPVTPTATATPIPGGTADAESGTGNTEDGPALGAGTAPTPTVTPTDANGGSATVTPTPDPALQVPATPTPTPKPVEPEPTATPEEVEPTPTPAGPVPTPTPPAQEAKRDGLAMTIGSTTTSTRSNGPEQATPTPGPQATSPGATPSPTPTPGATGGPAVGAPPTSGSGPLTVLKTMGTAGIDESVFVAVSFLTFFPLLLLIAALMRRRRSSGEEGLINRNSEVLLAAVGF